MISGMGLPGSRISTRNLGLLYQRTTEIQEALKKVGAENYVADEVLVKIRGEVTTADAFTSEYGAKVGKLNAQMAGGRLIQMMLPSSLALPVALALLEADARVEYVELNHVVGLDEAKPCPRIAIGSDTVTIGHVELKRRVNPAIRS